MKIVKNGDLERIKYERTEDVVVAQRFAKIYGVGEGYFPRPVPSLIVMIGPVLARPWYLEGLRTLNDVRNRKHGIKLSSHQEVCGCSHLVCVILTGAPSLKLGLKIEVEEHRLMVTSAFS